jgi:signal transduction histidine kinase
MMGAIDFDRLRRWWAASFVVITLLVLVAINEVAFHRSASALETLGGRNEARTQLNRLLQRTLDAEAAQRGYLLTGRADYLTPQRSAAGDVRAAVQWLQGYYRDPASAELMQAIARDANARLSEIETTLAMYDAGQHGAWRELMLTDIGREKMEGLRQNAQRLLELEAVQVQRERGDIYNALWMGRIGIDAILLLCVVGLWAYARQGARLERERSAHAQLLATERDRLEAQVVRRTHELTQLARYLQNAREDERSRLARELHDELGALLTAAKLDAARLKRNFEQMSPEAAQRFTHRVSSIDQVIALKRRIIEDLRPSSLTHLGLVAALEIHAREFAKRAELQVKSELKPVKLSESAQMTVYRLVQECFTNIAKYSGAKTVSLHLEPREQQARVCVSDDGKGFDAAEVRGGAHGLTGMRYRVESEGGHLVIDSAPGKGTRIEAWLPVLG